MSSLAEGTAALWEQRIRNNHGFLVDNLLRDLPSVIDCMIPEVFTSDDLDYVQRGDPDGTRLACNRRFLKRLLGKGPGACLAFIKALKEKGHDCIVQELEKQSSLSERAVAELGDTSLQAASSVTGLQEDVQLPQGGPVVQNVYNVYQPKNVFLGNTNTIASASPAGQQDKESLIMVLLKEILDQSPNGEEALRTLGEKLREKLCAVQETHIVSFQDFVGMPVKQFLRNKACHFRMTNRGNNIMVSNVIHEPFGDASLPVDQGTRSNDEKAMFGEDPACGSQSVEWSEVLSKKEKQMKRKKQKEKATSNQEQVKPAQEDPFITKQLNKYPGKNLILRPSGYKQDQAIDFTIDVVSLWNTPNRNRSYIILGVQTRSSLPHQVIGLKYPSSAASYHALFLQHLFQSPPKFSYKEVLYFSKRVGIITVEGSSGHGIPSIVGKDDKSSKLKKNQLWVRKGATNIVVEGGSDGTLLSEIYSWFKKPSAQQSAGTPAMPKNRFATLEPPCPPAPQIAAPAPESKIIESTQTQQCEAVETSELMEYLTHFRRGHFVLLCGSLTNTCKNLEVFSNAPFIAVYDFDVNGRETGLLGYVEKSLKKKRGLRVFTWKDPHTGVTERGTQWWSLRGRSDIPDSNLSEMTLPKWNKQVKDKMEKLCTELQCFSEDYTILTLLALWPAQEVEIACMQKFLSKLQDYIQPSVVLWFTDQETQDQNAREVKNIKADYEENVKIFFHGLEAFCSELKFSLGPALPGTFEHRLPAQDGTTEAISLEEAAWLQQDFEVLYLDNPYTKKDLTADDLKAEANNFFRGGAINWFTRYDMGPKCFDVERSISETMTKHIHKVYIERYRSGTVRLYHAPGSGGSTMSRRILFDLHTVTPCAHIKQRSGSSIDEIVERLYFLCDRTRMPLLVLLDGEDEQKLQQLLTQVRRNTIVALYVKRYPYPMDKSQLCRETESKFYLPGHVTKQESRNLVVQLEASCGGVKKKLAGLRKLDLHVQQEVQEHQMFEYGLTVYNEEFQGVRAYVKGYLQIQDNQNIGLWPWQKCLGYLAMVYHYGQSSLPCQFVGSLMGLSQVLDIEDLPYQMKMLVVPDVNEGKSQHVRVMLFAIATEILEQILSNSPQRTYSDGAKLSNEAKRNLKDFCIDFLGQVMKDDTKTSLTGQTVMYILTKTFIFRDCKDVIDIETKTKKIPPRFSPIMQDLDSQLPFHGRHEVLKKLCETFPDNPNFKAHLGRFFTLCRPEEEDEAERHFKEAIRLGIERDGRKSPSSDGSFDLDLMHIYHMYGCFFQRRISRKTNRAESAMYANDSKALHQKLNEVIFDANQACQNFSLCRQHSPPANKEAYQYLNEIDVRLQTCRFLNNVFPGGIETVLQSWKEFETCYRFVKVSISEVEDLIMECYNYLLLENINDLQSRVRQFNSFFSSCATELPPLADDSPVTSLRLSIMTKKLQFDRSDTVVCVESPRMSSEAIENIVSNLESIFEYEAVNRDLVKSKLELDFHDWILGIRNPNFRKVYSVEEVLAQVRHWHDSVRSPQSTFYLFILLSLLGFGTSMRPGSKECLVEAESLLELMQKMSKTDRKARHPREWLGREELPGIRRLVSNSSINRENKSKTRDSSERLAMCKGTIGDKPWKQAGLINYDIGCKTHSVKVFFVPAVAKLMGSRFQGERVQFRLGFTLHDGYEAFDVAILKKFPCKQCGLNAEITTEEASVPCKNCGTAVIRQEPVETDNVEQNRS